MDESFQHIKEAFSNDLINALTSKSAVACCKMLLSFDDVLHMNGAEGQAEVTREVYDALSLQRTNEFLNDDMGDFIDKKNAQKDSVIIAAHITKTETYDFTPNDEPFQIIDTISISMNRRLVDGVNYQVGFQIDDAIFVNGKIKISNWYFAKRYESFWDDINPENTPYPKITDQKKLKAIVKNCSDRETCEDVLSNLRDWYVHEGDLELESFDLKVAFIVTGNLTIKEPFTEIPHELIVLGRTKLTTLLIEETNDVLFLGGIEFAKAVFVSVTSHGAYQIFNRPRGPLFVTESETTDIDEASEIKCFSDTSYGTTHGDFHALLIDRFMPQDVTVDELDMDQIIDAIKRGETAFKD